MKSRIERFYVLLGRRVRVARERYGLSQKQLAEKLVPQVTRASIANIESGKQRILAHTLPQLAGALSLRVDDLIRAEDLQASERVAELRKRVRLTPEQAQRITDSLSMHGWAQTEKEK